MSSNKLNNGHDYPGRSTALKWPKKSSPSVKRTAASMSHVPSTLQDNSNDTTEHTSTISTEGNLMSKKNIIEGEKEAVNENYIENLTIQLSVKECKRSTRRKELEHLFEDFQEIRKKMSTAQEELQELDDEIELLEKKRDRALDGNASSICTQYAQNLTQVQQKLGDIVDIRPNVDEGRIDLNNRKEVRDDEAYDSSTAIRSKVSISMNPDYSKERQEGGKQQIDEEKLCTAIEDYYADEQPPPSTIMGHNKEDGHFIPEEMEYEGMAMNGYVGNNNNLVEDAKGKRNTTGFAPKLSFSSTKINNVHKAAPPAGLIRTSVSTSSSLQQNFGSSSSCPSKSLNNRSTTTIDQFFSKPCSQKHQTIPQENAPYSIFPPSLQKRYSMNQRNNLIEQSFQETHERQKTNRNSFPENLSSNDFPWSKHMKEHLQNTFKIRSFRDNQKEIINCTMSGKDAFVIMRTGGGKSLTYQLPALLEGKSPARKVTLVIAPLLSLIRDQEDQMNSYSEGSAISLTSGIIGGVTEHARRWNLVRNPDSGICMIFVTPEKVYKSNKLRGELEKLNNQGRLGRFVIDECHCASQWGHDFRPDYMKLGILKQHFPSIPVIALTATASENIREDCCRILKISSHRFFRSSADRKNLKYSVRVKVDRPDKVIEDMASFVKDHHPRHAGIIYTFSRKEADTVADKLNDYGISSRAYHSSVSASAKESIHRNWMRDKILVVVATIAFGLGINKPNVRFVLHHTLSKSLEAYYQESGRAGRDGESADCILYYAVKDISRVIGMIHGENGEGSFWPMVRYGQEHGHDALCRQIILSTLGEPGCASLEQVILEADANTITEKREVGQHAKTLVQLIQSSSKDLTIQQLVTIWRGKDAPDFIQENPPGSELNKNECERLIAALLLSDILYPKVVFTPYNSIVYIGLKDKAALLLSSPNAKVFVPFPIREATTTTKSGKNSAKKAVQDINGWLSKKQKTKTNTPRSSRGKKKKPPRKEKTAHKRVRGKSIESKRVVTLDSEVIDIIDDSDDEPLKIRKRPLRVAADASVKKMRAHLDIFEDSSSEREFNG